MIYFIFHRALFDLLARSYFKLFEAVPKRSCSAMRIVACLALEHCFRIQNYLSIDKSRSGDSQVHSCSHHAKKHWVVSKCFPK